MTGAQQLSYKITYGLSKELHQPVNDLKTEQTIDVQTDLSLHQAYFFFIL